MTAWYPQHAPPNSWPQPVLPITARASYTGGGVIVLKFFSSLCLFNWYAYFTLVCCVFWYECFCLCVSACSRTCICVYVFNYEVSRLEDSYLSYPYFFRVWAVYIPPTILRRRATLLAMGFPISVLGKITQDVGWSDKWKFRHIAKKKCYVNHAQR